MSVLKQKLWAPYYAALNQVVDAIAAVSTNTVLEHNLTVPPNLYDDLHETFSKRHPTFWDAVEKAYCDRNRAANAAAREKAKLEGFAKRKITLARKQAEKKAETFIRSRAKTDSIEDLVRITAMPPEFVARAVRAVCGSASESGEKQ